MMNSNGNVYLVRHGLTEENLQGIILGHRDYPLNAQGTEQAYLIARQFNDIDIKRIYCSPIKRAKQTAEIISRYLNSPIHEADEITEVNCGQWSGRYFDDMRVTDIWPKHLQNPVEVNLPGWETVLDCYKRSANFLESLFSNLDGNCILVSHGDIIRFMIAWVLKMDLKNYRNIFIEHCCISVITKSVFGFRLKGMNLQKLD